MSQIEFVQIDSKAVHGLALLQVSGEVWVTFSRPWWDLASWFWWWLSPGRKVWIQTRASDGTKIRVRAWRAAMNHVRVNR